MYFLNKLDESVDKISRIFMWIYAVTAIITIYEIFMRYILNSPTVWVHETVTYLGGFCLVLANNFCIKNDLHMRVDILYNVVSPRTKNVLNIFHNLCGIFLFVSLVYGTYFMFDKSWFTPMGDLRLERTGSAWNPIYPAILKAFLLFSLAICCLQHLKKLINCFVIKNHV